MRRESESHAAICWKGTAFHSSSSSPARTTTLTARIYCLTTFVKNKIQGFAATTPTINHLGSKILLLCTSSRGLWYAEAVSTLRWWLWCGEVQGHKPSFHSDKRPWWEWGAQWRAWKPSLGLLALRTCTRWRWRSLTQLRTEGFPHQVRPPADVFRSVFPGKNMPGMCRQGTAQKLWWICHHYWTQLAPFIAQLSSSIHAEAITVIDVPQTSGVLRLPTPRALKSWIKP